VELSIPLHAGPRYGGDNSLYLMKIPNFLSMESVLFDPEKFTAPTVDPGSTTSAYTQATNSIRFRRDPRDLNKMQSNARVIRWSDGSLSLQIASSPNLYDLPRKALTSDPNKPEKYAPSEDSHLYVLDPQQSADALRVVGHATQSLGVLSASATLASDHAIQRLQSELAGSISRSRKNLELSELKDPESDRREAERVVKEKERMNKRQEAQRRRARDRDPLESAARRSYQRVTGTRSKRDSPPLPGRGRGREDEYDLEDGFIEGSDADEEEADGSDEEEEEEEFEERRPRRERESERDRKRRRVVDESDEE
jgi:RNA polymerase-associated protein LEO1